MLTMFRLLLVIAVSLVSRAAAHGGVWNYSIAGEWHAGYVNFLPPEGQSSIQRHWTSMNPETNMTSPTLGCKTPGTPAEQYVKVRAGSKISAYYRGWPHNLGPVLTWMAYCGTTPSSCSTFDSATPNAWFKIDQLGLMRGTILDGWWAQRQLQSDNDTWTVTIPRTLKPGAYLYRTELISLHIPFTPEFYPNCAHFWVTGNGTETPGEEYLVSIPGVYKADHPSLSLDVFDDKTSLRTDWEIPSPQVWRGSGKNESVHGRTV